MGFFLERLSAVSTNVGRLGILNLFTYFFAVQFDKFVPAPIAQVCQPPGETFLHLLLFGFSLFQVFGDGVRRTSCSPSMNCDSITSKASIFWSITESMAPIMSARKSTGR